MCPSPPDWTVAWDRVREAFAWIRRLEGVPQDVIHHAEGDVSVHTRMAAQALAKLAPWRALPAEERVRLFAAVLLHDVAKPDCTRHTDDGRITAHGHSRRGDLIARRVLWELGAPVAWREHVAALVRHHQIPFWALERPDLERIVLRVSLVARNADLALLATADILGRVCSDTDQVLDNIELFREYCADALLCVERDQHLAPAAGPVRGAGRQLPRAGGDRRAGGHPRAGTRAQPGPSGAGPRPGDRPPDRQVGVPRPHRSPRPPPPAPLALIPPPRGAWPPPRRSDRKRPPATSRSPPRC